MVIRTWEAMIMDDEALGLGGKLDFLIPSADLSDPHQAPKLLTPLDEVLFLTLCALICGADGWFSVSLFGQAKLPFLQRFLPFDHGVPGHDQLGLIFGAFNKAAFQECFIAWTKALTGALEDVVAVDGKTLRGSFDRAKGHPAFHMVSAWSSQQKLVLGARTTDEKPDAITAIPGLLRLLDIKGATLTLDAMGCQKKIAETIVDDCGADYVLGLKGGQGALHNDVELLFNEQFANGFKDITVSKTTCQNDQHGPIETREVFATDDIEWLRQRHDWKGLNSIVMVVSTRETSEGIKTDRRFSLSSLPADAEKLGFVIPSHWGVENSILWVLDVNFRDDNCRIRKRNAPANFSAIKRATVNALKNAPSKESMKSKRLLAGWDHAFLEKVLRLL